MSQNEKNNKKAGRTEGTKRDLATETIIKHFGAVAHASRIHSVNNRAISRLLDWFVVSLNSYVATQNDARVELDGGHPFVNGAPVRASRELRQRLALFSEQLRTHVCGGFKLRGVATRVNVGAFFDGIRQPPSDRSVFQEWLNHNGAYEIELLPPRRLVLGIVTGSGSSVRVASTDALRGYARTITSVEAAVKANNIEKLPANIYRALQNMVDLAVEEPDHHLALTSLKEDIDERARHPVHVAILAIALGQRLGLERNFLVELGFAAVLVGTLASGKSDSERLVAVASLLNPPRMTPVRARRILAVYEHGLGSPQGQHIFSRIIALAVGYDRLTSRHSDQENPLLPDEALARLQTDPRYDAELVNLFTLVIGRYPLGAAVRLNTGEIGVVYHSPSDLSKADRPVVRLIRDSMGRPISRIVDLAHDQRQITGMIDRELAGLGMEFFQ